MTISCLGVVRGSCAIIFDSIEASLTEASPFKDFSAEGCHGETSLLSGKFLEKSKLVSGRRREDGSKASDQMSTLKIALGDETVAINKR